jgi:hypothetical protein
MFTLKRKSAIALFETDHKLNRVHGDAVDLERKVEMRLGGVPNVVGWDPFFINSLMGHKCSATEIVLNWIQEANRL